MVVYQIFKLLNFRIRQSGKEEHLTLRQQTGAFKAKTIFQTEISCLAQCLREQVFIKKVIMIEYYY